MSETQGDPSPRLRRINAGIWFLTLLGACLLIGMTIAAPLLRRGYPVISAFLYAVFAPLCHQIPSRCVLIHGYPMAVCGRCFGIYAGFVFGCGIYPFLKRFAKPILPSVKLLLLLVLPACLDFAANAVDFWRSPAGVRFVTGFILGGILPCFFIAGVSEAMGRSRNINAPASGVPRMNRPPAKPDSGSDSHQRRTSGDL